MIVNTPDGTTVRETERVVAEPTVVHTTEVRESNAAWWIGALVAIVAILAVVFLVTRSPATDNTDISSALEQGRAQGALEATQQGLSDAQAAAARAADQAAQATAEARDATARAAASAADATAAAADNVADTVTPSTVLAPAE
jgi:hypothetical protein